MNGDHKAKRVPPRSFRKASWLEAQIAEARIEQQQEDQEEAKLVRCVDRACLLLLQRLGMTKK